MNAPDATVARTLEQLERRELIRARSSTSIESEREFAFWHMLIRDVAYEQLPRATRAAKHAAVARWIDVSGARGAGLAEVRAYHYATAHQLACAIRDDDLAADLREPAMTAHKQAGDEALSTDVTVAERHYARACALTLPDDAIRPHLTVALAEAQIEEGRLADAVDQLLQGISALKAAGDRRAAAVAMTRLSTTMYWQDSDHSARARDLRAEALDMLAHDGPSEARVTVLEECAVQSTRDYIYEDAIRFADLAIAMNRALGLPERVRSIAYRGTSLCCLGNDAGLAELRRAWELAMSRGEALEADAACQLLAELTYAFEGPDAALALARRGYEYAARRGGRLTPLWFRQQLVEFGRLRGEWMESLADAIELGSIVDESDRMDIAESRLEIALVRVHQGDCPEAARLLDLVPDEGGRQQWLMTEVATLRAALQAQTGDLAGARESLRRLEPSIRDHSLVAFSAANLPLIVRLAFEAGVPELIVPLVRPPGTPRAIDLCTTIMAGGLTAEREGRLEDAERTLAEAAKAWSAFGNPWEAALALRDRGRCLLALGRASEAVAALSEARDVFRRLGARPALADAEALLARATEGSGSPTPGGTAPTRPAQASRDSGTRPAT